MLSAVESFGPASAAAAHPYAHHNPFAIAAAAAAAGSAAAAAAGVIPSHHHHHHHHHQAIKSNSVSALEHQFALNHSSIYSNGSVSATNNHISNSHLGGGHFLPPPPPTLSLITSSAVAAANTLPTPLALSSKCPTQEQPKSPRDRSPRSKTANFQGQDGSCANNMSSAEFARPHPKQPRYNNNNNNVNTTNNNNNNNNTNNHLNNNNNYTSNAIPLHLRSTKLATNLSKGYNNNNTNNCLNNNNVATGDKSHCNSNSNHITSSNNNNNNNNIVNKTNLVSLPRGKYSTEQSGPVNLVTNNNTNSVNNNTNHCRTPPTSLSSEVSAPSSVPDGSDCNRKQIPPEMYAQKLPFTAQSLAATSNVAAVAGYQYNYSSLFTNRAFYGPSGMFPLLSHHNTLRPCPTYLDSQHEAFSPYLPTAGVYQAAVPPNVPSQSNVGLLRTAPQVLINNTTNNGLSSAAKPCSPQERISYAQSSPKEISNTNGTYLNGKVNTSPAAPESVTGFKVPSGKEGSLKHRILTRPSSSDRDGSKRRSPITASIVRSNSNSSTSNFTKGAYIELANGVLRRVEDMRTEDFIQSAEKSAVHQLAESTVVKIGATSSSVIITFSYDKNRSKADVEVTQEHPFFVYGQGWASCNPELTLKSFGLKCQRLQVGDICISLISREPQPPSQNSMNNNHNNNNHQTSAAAAFNHTAPSQNFDKSESLALPQNLSRKMPTLPTSENTTPTTTAPVNNVTNRLTSMGTPTYIPYDETAAANAAAAAAAYENQISRHHEFYQPPLHLHHPYHRLFGHTEVTLPTSSRLPLPPPPPPPQSHSAPVQQSRPPSNQSSYYPEQHLPPSSAAPNSACSNDPQQQPVDASLSRKRRWSAPENICDDDENKCEPPSATAPRLSVVNAYNS